MVLTMIIAEKTRNEIRMAKGDILLETVTPNGAAIITPTIIGKVKPQEMAPVVFGTKCDISLKNKLNNVITPETTTMTPNEIEITFLILILNKLFNKGITVNPPPSPVKAVAAPLMIPTIFKKINLIL